MFLYDRNFFSVLIEKEIEHIPLVLNIILSSQLNEFLKLCVLIQINTLLNLQHLLTLYLSLYLKSMQKIQYEFIGEIVFYDLWLVEVKIDEDIYFSLRHSIENFVQLILSTVQNLLIDIGNNILQNWLISISLYQDSISTE